MKSRRVILTFAAAICLICAALTVSINAQDSTGIHLDEILAKANSGNATAMRQMGDLYLKGEEIEQDFALAAQWYQKAATKENIHAMGNLATLYYEGAGVAKDYKLAQQYALPAAIGGYHQALLIMEKLSATPDAGMQDPVEFVKWGVLAANAGNIEALDNLVKVGDQIGWADIEKGIERADSFKIDFSKALYETLPFEPSMLWSYSANAEHKGGFAWKSYAKAVHQVAGDGMPQDTSAGLGELEALAFQDFVHAMWALAIIYSNGKFLPIDNAKSFEYTALAAKQKHPDAQYQLGLMYFNGVGTVTDTAQAIDWIRTAAYSGNNQAQYDYAVIHAKGIGGLTPDLVEAYAWLSISAELGNEQAKTDLPTLEAAMTPDQKSIAEEEIATLRFMLGNDKLM